MLFLIVSRKPDYFFWDFSLSHISFHSQYLAIENVHHLYLTTNSRKVKRLDSALKKKTKLKLGTKY